MNQSFEQPDESGPVLSVRELRVEFQRSGSNPVVAVDGVSFDILPGETVGIVGESGSGKTMTARSIINLVPKGASLTGSVRFRNEEVLEMPQSRLRKLRGGEIAMVFQDPAASFNPVLTVASQIGEAIELHSPTSRKKVQERVVELLSLVGFSNPRERFKAFPQQFSGGMLQRSMIAMAIANNPALIIADEPTTALDVTVQDQIIQLMRNLNERLGMAILLITHNIAVVASLCDRVVVMYAGRVVEDGPMEKVLSAPRHPYTWLLLRSVPRVDESVGRLVAIEGQPPNPAALPSGCKFHTRCAFSDERCKTLEPSLVSISGQHRVRCWNPMVSQEATP